MLFRAAMPLLELELQRRDIPFVKFGGLKFLEAAHVKDLLALLRWAQNPRDRLAGFRVSAAGAGRRPGQREPPTRSQAGPDPPPRDAHRRCRLRAVGWRRSPKQMPAALRATRLGRPIWNTAGWYSPYWNAYDDARARRRIMQLSASARPTRRERFLTELTLDPPDPTSDESGAPHRDDDYLILSTIHSAKGQEWKTVYVLNVVDGCMPSDLATGSTAELEEERRLLYVAMTRAKTTLHL